MLIYVFTNILYSLFRASYYSQNCFHWKVLYNAFKYGNWSWSFFLCDTQLILMKVNIFIKLPLTSVPSHTNHKSHCPSFLLTFQVNMLKFAVLLAISAVSVSSHHSSEEWSSGESTSEVSFIFISLDLSDKTRRVESCTEMMEGSALILLKLLWSALLAAQ